MSFNIGLLRSSSPVNLKYQGAETDLDILETSLSSIAISQSSAISALENLARGKDVESHIQMLWKMVSSKEFSLLSTRDIQANILLILCRYVHTHKPEDLALLARILPYYVAHLSDNGNQLFNGILSDDLRHALIEPSCQFIHDLDLRVDQFLKGNSLYRYSKDEECQCVLAIIERTTPKPQLAAEEFLINALQCWSRLTQPTAAIAASVTRKISELGCALCNSTATVATTIETFERLELPKEYESAFYTELYEWQIQKFLEGSTVEEYAGFLESVLLGDELVSYRDFTSKHMLANILLLLGSWSRTDDERYLDLLLKLLPFSAGCLDKIEWDLPHPSSRKAFTETIERMLTTFEFSEAAANTHRFARMLSQTATDTSIDTITDCLTDYSDTSRVEAEEMKDALLLFARLVAGDQSDNASLVEKNLLKLVRSYYTKSEDNPTLAIKAVYAATANPEDTFFSWAEKLPEGPMRELFVEIVNNKDFCTVTKKTLFRQLLKSQSLQFALRLIPSVPLIFVPALLDKIDADPDTSTFALFATEIAKASKNIQESFSRYLQTRPQLLNKFDFALRKDAKHPAIDFYIETLKANKKNVEAVLQVCLHPKAPKHYTVLAARLLSGTQREAIYVVCNKLVSLLVSEPESPILHDFFIAVNNERINPHVRNIICSYLASQDNPACLLLLSKMSSHICLSELLHILGRIDALTPQDEAAHNTKRLALNHLLQATWYLDEALAKAVVGPWYRHHNIILFTKYDDKAVKILEIINRIMVKHGLTNVQSLATTKIEAIVTQQLNERKGNKPKELSYYVRFLDYFHRKKGATQIEK